MAALWTILAMLAAVALPAALFSAAPAVPRPEWATRELGEFNAPGDVP